MADKVSKQIIQWEVQGDTQAVASVGRVQAALNNNKKASDQFRESLTALRVEADALKYAKQYGTMARDIEKADDAARQLEKNLGEIGARKSEIAAAAAEFERFRLAEDGGGGKGGRTSKITQFGAKIRNLPSTRIPGTELATDAIGNLLRLFGAFPPVLLPIIAGLGAVGAAFLIMGKNLEGVREALKNVIEAENKYYKDIQELNTKQAQQEINRLKLRQALIQEQTQNELRVVQVGAHGVTESFAGIFDVIGLLMGETVEGGYRLLAKSLINRDITANLEALKKESEAAASSILLLEQGLEQGRFATNDWTDALKRFAESNLADIDNVAQIQTDINKLIADGSQLELEAKQKELAGIQDIASLRIALLNEQLAAVKADSEAAGIYTDEILRQQRIFANAGQELAALGDNAVQAAVKLNDANRELEQLDKERVKLVQEYEADVLSVEEAARKAQADAADKYNDALVKAAQTAAKAAENALSKLQDQTAKLALSNQRGIEESGRKRQQDALNDLIKYQQADAKLARDHAENLLDIKRDADDKEQDLIAARDFAGLFRSRRDTSRQLETANRQFEQERADRAAAFAIANEDRARQYAFEDSERRIKYQQANADAKAQYDKELSQANAALIAARNQALQARNDQLNIAASKYNAELQLLQRSIQINLQLKQAGYSAEQQLLIEFNAALARSISYARGIFAPSTASFAGASSINNTSTQNSINSTFNVRGNNPTELASFINSQLSTTFRRIFRD